LGNENFYVFEILCIFVLEIKLHFGYLRC